MDQTSPPEPPGAQIPPAAAVAQAAGAAPPNEGLPAPRRHVATAAVLAAIVLVVLDGAIANVALPTIARSLGVAPARSVWVVTGYQLALVMFLLPTAALGESRGLKRVYIGGVVVFTLASGLCAASPSLPWLVGARFVQGIASSAPMSLGLALLRHIWPHQRLGSAIGWNAMTVALAAAAGPTIGSAILSVASWPWLFAVNIPVGLVMLAASRALPDAPGTGKPLDVASVALNAGSFGALVIGIDVLVHAPGLGLALLALAAAGLATLVRREMHDPAPLIPLDLLRGRAFRISVIASVCCFMAQMTSYVALPFYLQHALGQGALATGLYMTPWPLAVACAAPIAGRLSDRVPTARLCAAGGACLALGLGLAAAWPLRGHVAPLVAFTLVCGLGFGFFQTPNNRNMQLSAPRARGGAAGGMQGAARLLGQTAGAVLMNVLFTLAAVEVAPRIGLAVAAGLALAGGLVSLRRIAGVDASPSPR
jgi:DHA2 family multidrug resistance protein-like MFS transporter